jgi:putative peptide zinc metalloprotease protein
MTRPEQCIYPPELAHDVEISVREEDGRTRFVVGSAGVGRYLMLGALERQVLDLLDGSRTAADVCRELAGRNGSAPALGVLVKFLDKLDNTGILAGEREGRSSAASLSGGIYLRWSLCNPNAFFGLLLPWLSWIWTRWFFTASLALLVIAGLVALTHWPEVARYGAETMRHHYIGIFVVAWLVTVTHEFAHGMTSKAFGGRATEIGTLLIYYCLPALYCNVTGLHMIPQRSRRLWVIAAGIYWQLLVGAVAFLVWFVFAPDTLLAQGAMIVVLGSLLEVFFNANPLIKLDGYYFLSQSLGIANLMDRSRAYWRALLGRLFGGEPVPDGTFPRRERRILLTFGLFSFLYNLALPAVIAWLAARKLMDWMGFAGLLLSGALVVVYAWRPVRKIVVNAGVVMKENASATKNWRRYIPAALAIGFVAIFFLPWTASVGSYGTLVAIPGREAVIRAAEGASLTVLNLEAGQQVAKGAVIGHMGNLDVEEQAAQVRSEIARVNAERSRLAGELGVQREAIADAEWRLARQRREFQNIEEEQVKIKARLEPARGEFLPVSDTAKKTVAFPPALAVLEAEIHQLGSRVAEAEAQRDRTRKLAREGLVARSVLESVEAKAAALQSTMDAAGERLHAALVEHERRHASTRTELNLAGSRLDAGRAQSASLRQQLLAADALLMSLQERLSLLDRKRAQFALVSPLTGTLFGEDLPRSLGQHFVKGTEICRVADTRELLVRMEVVEQAMGDVALGMGVRVKTRPFPDRLFRGAVTKIGGESELDGTGQRFYRVELTIQNPDRLLKPGMSVFARVDFGRHAIGWVLGHKLKQALRPELWML